MKVGSFLFLGGPNLKVGSWKCGMVEKENVSERLKSEWGMERLKNLSSLSFGEKDKKQRK